ncbi:hypothetical protein HDF16_005699 [Granulicella aggregans]|uniref:Uncharacterized protein n=1 Tax=Granulicella aggregans TaxID=474949 RepID=A0A7W8E692_9BACT|nr:hypothetical protein [Granulicella aggregans]
MTEYQWPSRRLCFVMAAFLFLAPSKPTAQVPTSGVSTANSTVLQAPVAFQLGGEVRKGHRFCV